MPLIAFDHVNVRTSQLDVMIRFYTDILGLRPGPRPPFRFGGAWMYLGDSAHIHLVEKPAQGRALPGATLEHFAFRAEGMAAFLARLDEAGISYTLDDVPDFPIVQVNFFDPDGNHIHIDFDAAERPD